ncbi:MAG: amidase [Vulcanimicrobiaceae bacterium]
MHEVPDDMTSRSISQTVAAIARADQSLHAWAYLDTTARETSHAHGPLANVAIGVKDIIDVRGMPTRLGLLETAPPARSDAWCVAALRAAGAVPIGKTATTAFAWRDPAPTRHPTVDDVTPGGSSSGSAAAVAAGHVAVALGTQTIGSTLRPAAYCGVVGFKPTYGTVPANGVAPLAPSVDHVGIIARDVAIATRCAAVFDATLAPETSLHGERFVPHLGVAVDAFADDVEPEAMVALARLADAARAAGARVDDVTLPTPFFETFEPLEALVAYEAYAVHAAWRDASLPPELAALLERGACESDVAHSRTLGFRRDTRQTIAAALAPFDAVLLAVAGPAPDRGTTGGARPAAPATFYGVPAISIPIARTARGLALGVQLIATCGADARLLAVASFLEGIVRIS